MRKKWIYLLLALLAGPFVMKGQGKQVSQENQQWIQLYSKVRLTEKFSWLTDGGYRWADMFRENRVYFLRTGAGYHFAPGAMALVGINVNGALSDEVIQRYEFRPYQEVTLSQAFGKFELGHGFRSEQRFFVRPDEPGHSFVQRFRYRASLEYPLFSLSRYNPNAKFWLSIADEIFVNVADQVVYNLFDKNRFMLSGIFQLNRNLEFSFTWNRQFSSRNQPGEFMRRNIWWVGVSHSLDLRKSGKGAPELTQNEETAP